MLFLYLSVFDTNEDKNKFTLLYYKYRRLMMKVAFGYVHDYPLAEDCVQNAFLDIAKNFNKVGEVDSPQTRAYVLTIVRTVSIGMYRKMTAESSAAEENIKIKSFTQCSSEDEFFSAAQRDKLLLIIDELPEDYRYPLILRYGYDYDYKQIAQLCSISYSNARKRVERAILMLKEKI